MKLTRFEWQSNDYRSSRGFIW